MTDCRVMVNETRTIAENLGDVEGAAIAAALVTIGCYAQVRLDTREITWCRQQFCRTCVRTGPHQVVGPWIETMAFDATASAAS